MLTEEAHEDDDAENGMTGGSGERAVDADADTRVLRVLPDGTKVKRRRLRMRACDELNAKGKICAGHLKRWYRPTAEVLRELGSGAELYRCERCHTIYLPNPAESSRTRTLAW